MGPSIWRGFFGHTGCDVRLTDRGRMSWEADLVLIPFSACGGTCFHIDACNLSISMSWNSLRSFV